MTEELLSDVLKELSLVVHYMRTCSLAHLSTCNCGLCVHSKKLGELYIRLREIKPCNT